MLQLPAGTAVSTKVMRGYRERRHAGSVLMCEACSKSATGEQQVVAVIVIAIPMIAVVIVFVALGVPLGK